MPGRKKSFSGGMRVIGITGGMASGKSTVARMFAGRGIVHLDADRLVHLLMQKDHGTITALAEAFPEALVPRSPLTLSSRDKKIDRAELASLIIAQPERLGVLEKILHPRVRKLEEKRIARARQRRARAVILDIPLLFETDAHLLCDWVITVRAPLPLRRRRAFARPGMTEEKWRRLLDRQWTDHRRAFLADSVIETGLSLAATRRAVTKLQTALGLR